MPRPQKAGIDYFPLDVNFFADKKVKILKARYGADGVAIYLYLLCEIYRAGYYIKFDDDALFITSDDLGTVSYTHLASRYFPNAGFRCTRIFFS